MFLASSLIFVSLAFSQRDSSERLNSIYFELGGNGGFYSLNYERAIPFNDHWGMKLVAGYSPQSIGGVISSTYFPAVPLQVKGYYNVKKNYLVDFGLGVVLLNKSYLDDSYGYIFGAQAMLSYQYFFYKKNSYIGVSFCPSFYESHLNEYFFIPWIGVRYGYKFNYIEKIKSVEQKNKNHSLTNLSATVGLLLPKIRFQYERGYKENLSYGGIFTYYLTQVYVAQFNGPKLEIFGRVYNEKKGNKEGFFLQGKVGAGYLFSSLYDVNQQGYIGYTIGGGVAAGYKLKLGNHLNLETILGGH